MKINPLAVFTGLTLATFAALVYVERNTGADGALTTTAKVAPLVVPEAPKPTEPAKVEAAPGTEVARWKNLQKLKRQRERPLLSREKLSRVLIRYGLSLRAKL